MMAFSKFMSSCYAATHTHTRTHMYTLSLFLLCVFLISHEIISVSLSASLREARAASLSLLSSRVSRRGQLSFFILSFLASRGLLSL